MMGLPSVLTTDQGKEFKNNLNKELMKNLRIKHHLITPYHPQVSCTVFLGCINFFFLKANGLDERFNQTLQRMLVKYLNTENRDTWDEFLDTCTFAYNNSR